MIRMDGASASHVGQIRKVNQDRAMFSPSLGAVADGMGGHLGGEQAASIVIGELLEVDGPMTRDQLVDVVQQANRKVYNESARPELRGMGTTVVAATHHADDATMSVVNVGDSRAYRLRGDRFEQLTLDHSLVEELVRQGRLSVEEARSHPQRNIVTRAVGLAESVEIDCFEIDAELADRYLLCSDGLVNEVPVDVIASTLARIETPAEAAERLVAMAVDEGGRDNVSVVVIDLVDDDLEMPARPDDVIVMEPVFVEPLPTQPVQAVQLAEPHQRSNRRRTFGILAGLFVVLAVALFGVNWYADNSYFASDVDGEVVILRGRPGGVLWVDPEIVENTGIATDDLNPASVERLGQETQWSSLDDVEDFVNGLERVEPDEG